VGSSKHALGFITEIRARHPPPQPSSGAGTARGFFLQEKQAGDVWSDAAPEDPGDARTP